MIDRIKKLPWLRLAQWLVIGLLCASALFNSLADHGLMMAINCFGLGLVVMSMIASKILSLMAARMDYQHQVLRCLTAEFGRALEEGRIEVVQVGGPPDVDRDHTTLH